MHPETPAAGKPLTGLFPGLDVERMLAGLRRAGAPYGIGFNAFETVANSRLALEASEFARDAGKYAEAHTRLFRAYFQEGLNIGEKQVLLELFKGLDLDVVQLNNALEDHLYTPRLQLARQKGQKYGVTGLPTFIINKTEKIVGAQSYAVFQQALRF